MRCYSCKDLKTKATDELVTKGAIIKYLRIAHRKLRAAEIAEIMGLLVFSRNPTRAEVLAWERGSSIVRNDAWVLAYILEVKVPDLAEEPI